MSRRRLPNFLRAAEQDHLLTLAQAQVDSARSPAKRRAAQLDLLLLQTGLLLGLRVSELCKLRTDHLDLERATATVYQGKGDRDRCLPIPRRLVEPLRAWLNREEPWSVDREPWTVFSVHGPRTTVHGLSRSTLHVFTSPRGGKLSERTVERRLERLGRLAQLPRRLKPHTLRHTYATRLLERGANIREVQELLGHSSVATTEIYTHVAGERLRAAVELL